MRWRLKNETFYTRLAKLPAPNAEGWIPFSALAKVGLREIDFEQRQISLERNWIQTKYRIVEKHKEIIPPEKVGYLLQNLVDYLYDDGYDWDILTDETKRTLFADTFTTKIAYEDGQFVLYHEAVIQEDEFEIQVRFNRHP